MDQLIGSPVTSCDAQRKHYSRRLRTVAVAWRWSSRLVWLIAPDGLRRLPGTWLRSWHAASPACAALAHCQRAAWPGSLHHPRQGDLGPWAVPIPGQGRPGAGQGSSIPCD